MLCKVSLTYPVTDFGSYFLHIFICFWRFLCKPERDLNVIITRGLLPITTDASTDDISDNELARLAKTDSSRFDELFDRFFTRVYQYFYFRLRHKQNAEDLTSETFMKIFTKLDSFQDTGAPFSAWVFAIARNTMTDFFRKNKVRIESIEDIAELDHVSKEFDMTKINRKLCMEKLWSAVRTLPEKQQDVWALKLTSDLPHKEIAKILGTSENNVNVMVNRSMKELKRRLSYLAKDS